MKWFLLLLYWPFAAFAFVNIEQVRLERDEGLSGSTGAKVEGKSGNTQRLLGEFSTVNLFRHDDRETILIGKYLYGESRHIKDTHEGNLHARYAFALSTPVALESFVQTEFSEFRQLKRRDLLGAGLRTRLGENLYLGSGAFYEHELFDEAPWKEETVRANLYLSWATKFGNAASASVILYYQPSLERFSDYRAQFDAGVSVPMVKQLAVSLELSLQKDSVPPAGVEDLDTRYLTGLQWTY